MNGNDRLVLVAYGTVQPHLASTNWVGPDRIDQEVALRRRGRGRFETILVHVHRQAAAGPHDVRDRFEGELEGLIDVGGTVQYAGDATVVVCSWSGPGSPGHMVQLANANLSRHLAHAFAAMVPSATD